MWTYAARIFKTSDGTWHFQVYRESQSRICMINGYETYVEGDVQVLASYTAERLIEAIEMASTLQIHVDNITELPLSQYAFQSTIREGIYVAG